MGFKVVIESGGGQASQPSLGSIFRFEIQGVALAAETRDPRFRNAAS